MPFGCAVIDDIHSVDHEEPANAKARQPRGHQKKGNSHLLMPSGYAVIADIHSVDHEKPANAKARQPRGHQKKGNSHLLMPFGYAVIADIHSVDHETLANAKARQPRGHQKKGHSHFLMPFGYAVIADIHFVNHATRANAKDSTPTGHQKLESFPSAHAIWVCCCQHIHDGSSHISKQAVIAVEHRSADMLYHTQSQTIMFKNPIASLPFDSLRFCWCRAITACKGVI